MSKGKTRYQFMSLLHEVLYFFISSFFSFPSFIENSFLCFVHYDVPEPPLIHSALEEESIPSSCVVDTDLVPLPLPILKDEICITPPLCVECPCSPEEVEDNSQSSQTLLPPIFLLRPPGLSLNPMINPPLFKSKSEIGCLNLCDCHVTLTLILMISLSIFLDFLGKAMLQLRSIWRPLRPLLISLRSFTRMLS
jgi:hypothetical protein